MEVSTALLKELKEKTGAGVVDCKNVLVETNGDMDKAIKILNEKGLGKADKKQGREAKDGSVLLKTEGKKGLVVKVNCETDFVAKTDAFKEFAKNVLDTVFAKNYTYTAELPADVEALRKGVIAKLGENILVADWKFINAKGNLYPYLHLGRVGAIVDMEVNKEDDEAKQLMKNIAMQITAMNPLSVDPSTIPAEKLEEVKKVFAEEAKATGKPEKVIENIVKGKLEKFYSESVLLEQVFIMDEEKKVKQVLEENKGKGIDLKIHSFVRASV